MSDTSSWYSSFGLAEAAAKRKRETRKISNQQAALLGQRRGQRNMAELQKTYAENLNPTVGGYARRGLMGPSSRSGIATRGLAKYAESLQTELGRESLSMQDELNRIQADEAASQADLEDYLAQLRIDKQRAILADALNIKSLASY